MASSALLGLAGSISLASAIPPQKTALLAAILFAVGIAGVACRRNVLIMLLSVEIMLNAANLMLVTFSKVHGDPTGQVFVFFGMVVAAAEVTVGLAIVVAVYRLRRTTDVRDVGDLKEIDYGPVTYPQLEGQPEHHHHDDDDDHGDVADSSSEPAPVPAGHGG